MFKIKPLNRDSVSDDDGPVIRKEAQEENALAKYNKALKLQCSGNHEEAQTLLQSLLDDDIPVIEKRGGLPKTMSTLKYSCYLNIGTISNVAGSKQKALDYFAQASELDKTDVTLWFKIGSLALELDHFKQSAYALSKGLECNRNHWPSLDKLIMLLYAMRDSVSCLHFISQGLQLDPDYIRGLMLRKRIYENNPGTQEYYQLFNPDHIYDPPLNTAFDEVEGKELENESHEIFERIRALELELETKPLPVLPLSKPLNEFTWTSLGQSIIHMHRYIAENKLSFISRITLSESIHDNEENKDEPEPEPMETEDDMESNNNEKLTNDDKASVNNDKENAETAEPESDVASEVPETVSDDTETEAEKDATNKDGDTAADEDNLSSGQNSKSNSQELPETHEDDELRKSESDNTNSKAESSVDKSAGEEKTKSKTPNRRRRNSLSFLQPWAWHSKRKSARKLGKNDRDDTIEGALRRIIPNNILPNGLKTDRYKHLSALEDDSMNTMDLYKLFVEDQEAVDSPVPTFIDKSEAEKYFGTQQETDDVDKFWKHNWERCDVISLLEKYVTTLAALWEHVWPETLRTIYVEAYEMYREHFDHPHVFSESVEFAELKTDTLITLLYSELIFDTVQTCLNKNANVQDIKRLPCSSLSIMELVCTRKSDWSADYLKTNLRLHWLKANIYMAENKNDLAIRSLNSIIYLIMTFAETNDEFYLILHNCSCNNLITLHSAEKQLKSLEMCQKLACLESLFENKNFTEVITILKETFKLTTMPKFKTKVDRPVQIVMLLHALWLTDRQECFIWSEICLNESLPMFYKTHAQPDSYDHKRWALVVVKCMVLLEACIKEESIIILDSVKDTQTRLAENLTSIICHQLNSKSMENCTKMQMETVKPWILLHYILQREEHRVQAKRSARHCKNSDDSDDEQMTPSAEKSDDSEEDEDKDVPPSVSILFSAHEFLGRRGWCLQSDGELLLFLVDVVLYRLNAPIFEGIKEKIQIHIEQAFFCLYQHPSKKNKVSRHLADHNVDPLSLKWDRAQQLYEFYQPEILPEFDSLRRYSSISNEMEQLLLRILALVPPEHDPNASLAKVTDFVNGQTDTMPESVEFPYKVSAVYYLLGDYYLKMHEIVKGLKYFYLDLCINPTRLDTWADMALAMASQLETKLNHCESFRNESEFLDKVRSAQVCFKQSLELSNGHSMLWIEYGNFVYMGHSFCSRILKGDTEMLSMEKFEALESQKEAMLDTAMECFTAANLAWQAADPGEHDERWLHHYMLGKIAEKKKQDPTVYLEHYNKAAVLLYENKATYPLKINYSNPQNLSVEALEIHYRIHASILKYLELHEDKPISRSVGRIFQKYLRECENGPFNESANKGETQPSALLETAAAANQKRPANETAVIAEQAAVKKRRLSELTVFEDVANTLEDILNKVGEDIKMAQEKKQAAAVTADDVVMIIDSDEDTPKTTTSTEIKSGVSTPSTDSEIVRLPKIRVRNAQEIMDDLMKKCMANQPEYKSETETDVENEPEKTIDVTKTESVQKQPESVSSPSRRGSTTSTAATTTTTSTSDSSDTSSSDDSSDTLYRLTHFYLNNKTCRSLTKCRQLMLAEYRCTDSSTVAGLFSERRNNNFFNGVWRIPTSEIDRPGSFAAHMSRCVLLLMQVLRDSEDHKTLLDLCLLLRRTPDPDKIYIRDTERKQLSDQALSICIQCIRSMLKQLVGGKKIYTESEMQAHSETDMTAKLTLDIYRSYQKVQKHLVHKENVFSGLLIDTYKHYIQNKLPEGGNILEAAIKFCQQRKIITKPVVPQQLPVTAITVKQSTPTVSTIQQQPLPATTIQPLRKTSKGFPGGRPRGRPPNINKHLSGLKSTKSVKDSQFFSPQNPFAWQNLLYSSALGANIDPKLALNYMMSKYQEELMRQYSQQLSSQTSMLTNPFAVNQLMAPNVPQPAHVHKEKDKGPVASTSKAIELPARVKASEKRDKANDTTARYSKEANKPYYVESTDISMFKDRPGISITPIHQATVASGLPKPVLPSSPTKTLQQKLAERQKQNPAAQQKSAAAKKLETSAVDMYSQYQNYAQKSISFAKPSIPLPPVPHSSKLLAGTAKLPGHYKSLTKNIPSALTIMKSQQSLMQGLQTGDSGISISQVAPHTQQPATMMNFRKPSASAPKLKISRKLGSDITVTPNYKATSGLETKKDTHVNIPLSLSITKKDEHKTEAKKDDAMEIITIE
ncbi:hypothetical protein CBL_11242 [Carabus blaptoides fortunei]